MNANELTQKYKGLQTKLLDAKNEIVMIGDYGCLFLCLCSIAEEFNESHHNRYRVDIIADYIACRSKGWIGKEFYIKDSESILNYLTGAKWKRESRKTIPNPVPENMYTVEKWCNTVIKNGEKKEYTHFRRRWGDTLVSSNTVKNGKLTEYYCFVCSYK